MLCYDPNKRYSAEQCLAHPYLKDIQIKQPSECNLDPFDWSFDNVEMKKESI
jgi:mitogen-activated protein kinase 1/3